MPGYPHGQNTFLPSHQATGGLLVGFSRNQEDFPLNKYMQIVRVSKDVGAYAVWTSREAARVLSADDREHFWPDGQDAPHGRDELESFEYRTYRAKRYLYPFTIGDLAVKQADWPVLNAHSRMAAQKAMTARTRIALAALQGASWGSNEIAINGGLAASGSGWDTGTPTNPLILDSLNQAAQAIHKGTIGGVKPTDLILVVGPALARQMAKSQKIHAYLKESPFAKDRLGIGGNNQVMSNRRYGLPEDLYGYAVIVEDTPVVTSRKGAATESLSYVLGEDEAYLIARPGGLEGVEGTPSFSTLQGFFFEEFTVELKQDPDNRRTQGRIVSHYDIEVVSTLSGVRFTQLTSDDSSDA